MSTILISMSRSAKVGMMLVMDLAALPVCFMLALILTMESPNAMGAHGTITYLLVPAVTIAVFWLTGLYGAVIRFIDQRLFVITGIALGAAITAMYFAIARLIGMIIPYNVLVTYWFIAFAYVVISRMGARAVLHDSEFEKRRRGSPRVAVYGAGEAGVKLSRAMRVSDKYQPVCFFDDKPGLNNRRVAGLKVFQSARISDMVRQSHVDMIVVAIPSATKAERKAIFQNAQRGNVPVKTLGNLLEIEDESITTRSIREIRIDDLLGREPIQPDMALFKKCVSGQNLLVTGAGGSIGSELCRQIMTLEPKALHLIDHCEYALYNILQELKTRYPHVRIEAHLGSVCDSVFIEQAIGTQRIDTIYHAAAYKHVPLVEENMAQGVRNNVLGAEVVADAAEKFKVKTCVLVTTDKAVRPTSMMGASKRIAELIFQAAARKTQNGTIFCMVRFGNVLGSSGSVVPLFKEQIERGGPVTITDPEVIRYFMSLPEAAQLVMQAGSMATGGDVFVMDMGSPVKILDLARTMIAMYGLREKGPDNPDGDIEIKFVGLRPGEKLYEELFAGNDAIPSRHPRIMTTMEYVVDPEPLSQQIAYLMMACRMNDTDMIRLIVKNLVHDYAPAPAPEPVNDDSQVAKIATAREAFRNKSYRALRVIERANPW